MSVLPLGLLPLVGGGGCTWRKRKNNETITCSSASLGAWEGRTRMLVVAVILLSYGEVQIQGGRAAACPSA